MFIDFFELDSLKNLLKQTFVNFELKVQMKSYNLILIILNLDTLAVMGNFTEFARVYNLGIKYIL